MHIILYMLLSLNWEGERTMQYLGRVEGENGFKVYLASLTGFFWEYFLFYGLAGFCTAWLEDTRYLLVQNSFCFSPEFWRQFQYILSCQMLSWNAALLLHPEFWHEITHLVTATHVLKTPFFFPISADEKGASGFRVLANHLASFFFLTLSGYSFGLLSWSLCPFSTQPTWGYGVQIAWPWFVTSFNRQAEELTYIPYSSL